MTALDLSPELLQMAEQRARERGLTNITTREADANKVPFADHSFDLVTSRCGVMFLREDAPREAYRVLRPGAHACFPRRSEAWRGDSAGVRELGLNHRSAQRTCLALFW